MRPTLHLLCLHHKTILVFGVISLSILQMNAQEWVLSIKPGAAISLAAPCPSSRGYAYKTASRIMPYPQLAIEISKQQRTKKNIFFGGFGLRPVANSYTFNEKNIDLSKAFGGALSGVDYAVQVYGGIEKELKKKNIPLYKNYFSVFFGISLNYYWLGSGDSDLGIQINNYAQTYSGQQLTGTKFGLARSVFAAPSFLAGLRYNITNSKGKTVVAVDLSTNFGFVKYFDHKVSYQIDGQDRVDYLAEKGWNIQLNVKIPLKTFHKKKK